MQNRRTSFGYDELLACARGELFGTGNAQLPLPPMLMFDRISEIAEAGGEYGKGRALGLGELKLSGQVLPTVKQIIYGIDIKRVMRSKLVLGVADGWLSADGSIIYRAMDLKVGLFRQEQLAEPGKA